MTKQINDSLNIMFNNNIINMKYNIGTHIWVVYEYNSEVQVHDDWIESFSVDEDRQYYLTKDGCMELTEDEIILYEDKNKLYKTIQTIMNKIREDEAKSDNQ